MSSSMVCRPSDIQRSTMCVSQIQGQMLWEVILVSFSASAETTLWEIKFYERWKEVPLTNQVFFFLFFFGNSGAELNMVNTPHTADFINNLTLAVIESLRVWNEITGHSLALIYSMSLGATVWYIVNEDTCRLCGTIPCWYRGLPVWSSLWKLIVLQIFF